MKRNVVHAMAVFLVQNSSLDHKDTHHLPFLHTHTHALLRTMGSKPVTECRSVVQLQVQPLPQSQPSPKKQSRKLDLMRDSVVGSLFMPHDALVALSRCSRIKTYRQGNRVFCEGDSANSFMVLTHGSVAIETFVPLPLPPTRLKKVSSLQTICESNVFSSSSSHRSSTDFRSKTTSLPARHFKHAGDVFGGEELVQTHAGSARNTRAYTARCHSETAQVLVIAYCDVRNKVLPLLGVESLACACNTPLYRLLLSTNAATRPVPTLRTVLPLAHCPLTSKYSDSDLLLHPLFLKMLYEFAKTDHASLSQPQLIEFWRDTVNYRVGHHRGRMSAEMEARILKDAYIDLGASNLQRHLPNKVRSDILARIQSGAPNLFAQAEEITEAEIICGVLWRFKRSKNYAQMVIPFVRMNTTWLARNQASRAERSAYSHKIADENTVCTSNMRESELKNRECPATADNKKATRTKLVLRERNQTTPYAGICY
jgi:hypothetical protein